MTVRSLTAEQFPYTGPYGAKSSGHRHKGPTVTSLYRMVWRLGLVPESAIDTDEWGADLGRALARWDPGNAGYGTGRWKKARAAKVPAGKPHAGELALDATAIRLVNEEYDSRPKPPELVYLHPLGVPGRVGGIHPTGGLSDEVPGGNWALDFLCPGGTPVLAPFSGTITRTSGKDPRYGIRLGDRFGYSIYLRRDDGVWAFMTHFGVKLVRKGQTVKVGQEIGTVGHWPHDEGRSHTHCGISAGTRSRSIAIVEAISRAPRVRVQPV